MSRLVAVNDFGVRIGESHGRAKLTNHDVELILDLLDCRAALVAACLVEGLSRHATERRLHVSQLSYAGIAAKFEVSKSQIRWIALGSQRGQVAARWVRVP